MNKNIEKIIEEQAVKYYRSNPHGGEYGLQGFRYFLEHIITSAVTETLEEERQFVLNILDGIDAADKQMGNKGGGTKAIRHALKSRLIN